MDFLKDLSNMLGGAGGRSGSGGSTLDALSALSSMFGQGAGAVDSAPPPSPTMGAASRGGLALDSRSVPDSGPGADGGLGDLLGGVLGSGALTGILGSLFSGKGAAGGIGAGLGALLNGGAERLTEYRDRIDENNAANDPDYGKSSAHPSAQAEQILRALIYAAKADGHIDAREQQALQKRFSAMNLGPDGQALVNKIMAEPLDPTRIAQGVRDADQALRIFTISCAAINIDQFMEKNYLEALAKALGVPNAVRDSIMAGTHPGGF
ncbi:MAG: tellurite resistance TerB family protein [Planctomycetota bacterium]|jgi:uncharacterized membrane protein YebE (DUF533 family)|nr:tellurite resistance TerB family protein [Planctomycetota bacterium]